MIIEYESSINIIYEIIQDNIIYSSNIFKKI